MAAGMEPPTDASQNKLHKAIRKEQPRGLSREHTHQIHNVARMLAIEAILEHPKMDHRLVIQNLIEHKQNVTQAISEELRWRQVLNELLYRNDIPQESRDEQASFLQQRIDNSRSSSSKATAAAQAFAGRSETV